jgi:glutaredoxin-related protein
MSRPLLDESRLHSTIRESVSRLHADVVQRVDSAARAHPVLVVGMATNPFCKRARRALDRAAVAHEYLEFGSYLGGWRERLALKMWSGWPTFPMVFVRGTLVGGHDDLTKLIASGDLRRLLA